MSILLFTRLAAILGALVGVFALLAFSGGFAPAIWIPLALWAAAPPVLGYWLMRKLSPTPLGERITLATLLAALAFAAWIYWEMIFGQSAREQSLAGLIVLFGPLYQYAILAIGLVGVFVAGRLKA